MSTISEVDIRDWDKVDFNLFNQAEKVSPHDMSMLYFQDFVKQVELIRDKQIKASQQSVAALLRRPPSAATPTTPKEPT